MADKTISDLVAASQVNPPDLFVLEQNATAKKLSGQTLVTYLLAMIDGHGGITDITWTTSGQSGNGQTHTGTITFADGTTNTIEFRDGLRGLTGAASFVWIKYASRMPTTDTDLGDNPDSWMGIYSGTSSTAPTTYTSYTWYKIKGETGPGAQLVSRTVEYQESSSPTSATGTWQSTVPTVRAGYFLWTHVTLAFDSGSPVEWFEVAHQGVDGVGSVSSVNSISPDANHNVLLTASDIDDGGTSVHDKIAALEGATTDAQSKITATGILKGSGSGVVGAATKGDDYGARSFTITLASNGWSNNTQTITDSRFATSGYAYMVSPASASRTAYNNANIYADDVTVATKMTFHCDSAPSGNLTVNVIRMVSA